MVFSRTILCCALLAGWAITCLAEESDPDVFRKELKTYLAERDLLSGAEEEDDALVSRLTAHLTTVEDMPIPGPGWSASDGRLQDIIRIYPKSILFQELWTELTQGDGTRETGILLRRYSDVEEAPRKMLDLFQSSKDAELRQSLLRVAEGMGNRDLEPMLIEALSNNDPKVLETAISVSPAMWSGNVEKIITAMQTVDLPPTTKQLVQEAVATAQGKATVGVGFSRLSRGGDIYTVAKSAAATAAKGVKGQKAKFVWIFHNMGSPDPADDLVMKAVSEFWDKSIIHGCSTRDQFTNLGNSPGKGIAVLVLCADSLKVVGVSSPEKRSRGAKNLGEAMAAKGYDGSGLIMLVGDAHGGTRDLLGGFQKGLGRKALIVGGSSEAGGRGHTFVISHGVVIPQGSIAVWLHGVNVGTGGAGGRGESIPDTAREAARTMKKRLGKKTDAVFIFDCVARSNKQFRAGELSAIQDAVGKEVPIVAMYGSGEIGRKNTESESVGVGHHIMMVGVAFE